MGTALKRIGQQAKFLLRRASGASRAVAAVEHTATHLANVERWAQGEFQLQRSAHEYRLQELERRVGKIEKLQHALSAAARPEQCPNASTALDTIQVAPSYFEQSNKVLEEIERSHRLFAAPTAILELYSGAAKSKDFLLPRASRYLGVEPSAVLREAARRLSFGASYIDTSELSSSAFSAERIVLIGEKQRWSVFDIESLLALSEPCLGSEGVIVLHIPYLFEDLEEAGWKVQSSIGALGLQLRTAPAQTSYGSYVLIARKAHV